MQTALQNCSQALAYVFHDFFANVFNWTLKKIFVGTGGHLEACIEPTRHVLNNGSAESASSVFAKPQPVSSDPPIAIPVKKFNAPNLKGILH